MQNSFTITEDIRLRIEYKSPLECDFSQNIDIEFAPLPTPFLTSSDVTDFCIGDSVEITLDSEYANIIWKNENSEVIQEGSTRYKAESTGSVYVVAENDFGCIDSSNVIDVIVRNDTNQLDFSAMYSGEFLKISDPEAGETSCGYILLENFSWKPLVLDNPNLLTNTEFSIPSLQLPIEIEPFGQDSIFVCFKSFEAGLREDFLLIEDLCFDHSIPINANSRFNEYQGESECKLDILFQNFNDTDFYTAFFGSPYPNPGRDFTFCEFVEYEPDNEDTKITGELLNQLGEKLLDAEIRVNEEVAKGEGVLRYGEIYFDTSNLQNGAYQLLLISPVNTETKMVIISK
jgi:hypothetical protein